MEALDLKKIYESRQSAFYKKHWGKLPATFSEVPLLHAADLVRTPLYERLYKDERGLVKFASRNNNGFLIRRSLSDIKNNNLELPQDAVPLVLLSDPNEGLEHSLWCYEYGTVPYIGDLSNLPVTLICASQFKTNTLISDMAALLEIVSLNEMPETIKNIYVIDSSFADRALLKEVQKDYHLKLFLSLPEAGIIASVKPAEADRLRLMPQMGVSLEDVDGKIVVTKPELSTPLIRYTSDINMERVEDTLYLN